MIRPGTAADLETLLCIEKRSFDHTDRLSRRNFRYLLTKAHGALLVATKGGRVRGYTAVLLSTGTALARLYSFAVEEESRRQGIGNDLLEAAEHLAEESGGACLRTEVRKDNDATCRLLQRRGYRRFGVLLAYYDDDMDALRYEKTVASPHEESVRVPYYQQTLDFTCGPAALMMAMQALDPGIVLDRKLETRLWRESTTIFMTSGHGGCGPYGMALSAYHRAFDVEVYVNTATSLFIDSVRSPEKKVVMRLVEEDFLEEIRCSSIVVHDNGLSLGELEERFRNGWIPVVLISSYRIYQEKFPHWLVVTGFDERYIYVHDPLVESERGMTFVDRVNMPIPKKEFERMTRYGKVGQKAALVLRKKATVPAPLPPPTTP
ncbi:Ribosomal-protein-alanine acetyltransferase [Gammaproteobacteria bacterium]